MPLLTELENLFSVLLQICRPYGPADFNTPREQLSVKFRLMKIHQALGLGREA
jgi:hypothetical protein